MPSAELRRLYKLHLVDLALLEIRKRAAALDPGKKTAAEIHSLEEELATTPARTLQAELTDLELKQKGFQEKIAKFEKELYGGKVVNPREVEAIQKEIGILKRSRGDLDGRILEIWEELPPAKERAAKLERALAERKQLLAQEQKAAIQTKTQLEAEFKQKSAERPALAKELSATLLARYEGIRQKHGGVGIGEVDVKRKTCGACGTSLPTRTIEALKEDKLVTCESCHRILYYSEGVV
ncbi:MAG TPA: C4-type zinc ribbon domain-containing protein [Fimbriimonadaceae bacterium]|nr:C4-type zinc ribbon domain-containing protein [Fimbriimonadaceae bacterium]